MKVINFVIANGAALLIGSNVFGLGADQVQAAMTIKSMFTDAQAPLDASARYANDLHRAYVSIIKDAQAPMGESSPSSHWDRAQREWSHCAQTTGVIGKLKSATAFIRLDSDQVQIPLANAKFGSDPVCMKFRSDNYSKQNAQPVYLSFALFERIAHKYDSLQLIKSDEIFRRELILLRARFDAKLIGLKTQTPIEQSVGFAISTYLENASNLTSVDQNSYRADLQTIAYSVANYIAKTGGDLRGSYPFALELDLKQMKARYDRMHNQVIATMLDQADLRSEILAEQRNSEISTAAFWSLAFAANKAFFVGGI